MLFGHNSNVAVGAETVHVQTEDRGIARPIVDTTVHWKGRVLHRRTNPYNDLLPLDELKEAVLKDRIDDQHRTVMEEIRSGALKLVLPGAASVPPAVAAAVIAAPVVPALKNRIGERQKLVGWKKCDSAAGSARCRGQRGFWRGDQSARRRRGKSSGVCRIIGR